MRKLFSDTDFGIPSLEIIEAQLGDKVIKNLESVFSVLINAADTYETYLTNGEAFFKHKKTKVAIALIDKILTKRFGVTYKHANGDRIGYATIPVPPKNVNVLNGEVFNTYELMLDTARDVTDDNSKNLDDIKDLNKDSEQIAYKIYKSFNSLEKTLGSKGVTIDLKKAKISGLPKDYVVFLLTDLYQLIIKAKLTAIELTAVLLHEIGHGFTHLEYSYRTVKTTSVLIDTLKSNIDKGTSYDNTLKLLYADVLDGDVKDLDGKDSSAGILIVMDKYMALTTNMDTDNTHQFTDSEQLADQFSARFGVSAELATALNKMVTMPRPLINDFMIIMMAYSFLIVLLKTANIVLAITAALVQAVELIVYQLMSPYIIDLILGGLGCTEKTYDGIKRRYIRLKHEQIRQLRSIKIDKAMRKQMLESIAIIDKVIDVTISDTRFTEVFTNTVIPWNVGPARRKMLEEKLEDLTENDLHSAAAKLSLT